MLSQVVELIETKAIALRLLPTVRPDGDSLGSSLGLLLVAARARIKMSKSSCAIRRRMLTSNCRAPKRSRYAGSRSIPIDAVFVIECSDITRPGLIDLEKQFVVNIDHHSTTALFGKINWIDSTASAVGEMIYNLCKATGVRVTKEIAECVYTALITDTGSFHYSNTTERTFKIASELVRTGVKPAKDRRSRVCQLSMEPHSIDGPVLSTARRDDTGRVACMRHTLEMQSQRALVGRRR